jgi:Outer membrane protein beta-barrel domain
MRPWILAGVLLSMLPSAARSQTLEITPMAGYRFGGTLYSYRTTGGGVQGAALEVGDGAAFGVHLGYRFDDFEFEVLYARQATNLQTPGLFTGAPVMDLNLDTWQGGGNYLFGTKDAKVVPFIGFGLGFTRLSPRTQGLSDETRFSASFAGGAKFWLGKHVGIRVEGRYFLTVFDSESERACGGNPGCDGHPDSRDLSQGEGRAGLILRF